MPEAQPVPRRSLLYSLVEFIVMVAVAVVLALIIRTFVVEPFVVPTGSMKPTIQPADQVLVNKFIFRFEEPSYGDVVVLDDPTGETPMLIKRIIAVGGQTLDVRDGRVWIDGDALDEPYTHGSTTLPGPVALPVRLPPETVWVMGDNREQSKDSRWIGPQPESAVHGKAFVVYWPPGRIGATFGI